MNKKLKCIQDVQNVPENEHIWTVDFKNETCLFCGVQLHYQIVRGHHGTDRLYDKCTCEVAKAAEEHNKRVRELARESWLHHRETEAKERQSRKQ
jgi:hypothetical protein